MRTTLQVTVCVDIDVEITVAHSEGDDPTDLTSAEEAEAIRAALADGVAQRCGRIYGVSAVVK